MRQLRFALGGGHGYRAEVGMGAVRFSLGRMTTRDEIDVVVERLTDVFANLVQNWSSFPGKTTHHGLVIAMRFSMKLKNFWRVDAMRPTVGLAIG
jgi:hypothetical protein